MAASDFAFELWAEQPTAAARRNMLRQFIGELMGAIGSGGHVGASGRFRDPRTLGDIHRDLLKELARREKLADAEVAADGTKRPLKFHALQFVRPS